MAILLVALLLAAFGRAQTITGATINGKPLRVKDVGTRTYAEAHPATGISAIRYRIHDAFSPLQAAKIRGAMKAVGGVESRDANVTIVKQLLRADLPGYTHIGDGRATIFINAAHDQRRDWSFGETIRHEARHLRTPSFHP